MMKHFASALGALSIAALSGTPSALAQSAIAQEEACAPREEIVAKLAHDFNENQQAVGQVNEQAVLEVFVSDSGTWTIIATDTDGSSCVISAGQDWEANDFSKGLGTEFHPASLPKD